MNELKIINVALWAILGVLNLTSDGINKFDYVLVWGLLMLHLIVRCFE